MFNNSNYSDAYEREKLRILQTLNEQIETMAIKLDQIVSHVEQVHFKLPPSQPAPTQTLQIHNHTHLQHQQINNQTYLITSTTNDSNKIISHLNNKEFSTSHTLITINDVCKNIKIEKSNVQSPSSKRLKLNKIHELKQPTDTTLKEQQRLFNTFVRESISQLLGPDFMRDHDVQDIDAQVMEMIRKEAVANYLPDNIRPRRAWHLAKASLRTLKRTLNNRKSLT